MKVGDKIKIGRKEYEIQKGDYIQFNHNSSGVHLFCSGDGRTLRREKWSMYDYLHIPSTVLKKIKLKDLRKVETGSLEQRTLLTRYYFD
jgi:hypothetical protein